MHDDCVVYIKKVTRVKEILDGKWKLQILCAMRTGPVRLSQLTRLAPAASKKGIYILDLLSCLATFAILRLRRFAALVLGLGLCARTTSVMRSNSFGVLLMRSPE